MDILTQGLLGCAMAQTVAQPHETRRSLLLGFTAGIAADADIFINSSQDPLLTLEYHRQFTHSIFFIPLGALIVAVMLWFFMRQSMTFARVYLFCLLGYSLSGFIDACTSYGTQLLWPFSDERIAFNIISIVDPLFTMLLLVLIMAAAIKRQRRLAIAGLVWCASYLFLGFLQHQRVEQVAMTLAASRDHRVESLVVKPSFGNLLVWRAVYKTNDHLYVDGIRAGLADAQIYQGESVPRLDLQLDLPGLRPGTKLTEDIERFRFFSDGYIALLPGEENVIGDMRYSILPNSMRALWGIKIDSQQSQHHATFATFRQLTPQIKSQFVDMLTGRYPAMVSP